MGMVLTLNRYDWPVLVPYPNPTILGQFEQRTLMATFEPIDNDTEEELLTGLARAGRQRDQRRERLRLVLKGLSGLLDASGAPMNWAAGEGEDADQRLEQILNDPRLVPALDRAYIASVAGTSPGKVPAAKEGYVLDTAATWRFPIDVELPDPKRPGRTNTHRVIGTFKDLTLNEGAGNATQIQDVLVDVDGFQDSAGKALPWNAVRSEAWKNPFISNAILLAYQRGIDGTAVQARREKTERGRPVLGGAAAGVATPSATPELDQDLALAGDAPELAARMRADVGAAKVEAADCCLVRPDCWDIVMAWRVICGQWRTASPGGMAGGIVWMGLDYASVAAGLSGMGIDQTPDLWWGLRVMEAEAKGELNK